MCSDCCRQLSHGQTFPIISNDHQDAVLLWPDNPPVFVCVQVTKMKMISPSNREVDVGKTLSETEYIGMCRREVLDAYLRDRAKSNGATVYNGLFMRMEKVRASPAHHLTSFCAREKEKMSI